MSMILCIWEGETGGWWFEYSLGKSVRPYVKNKPKKGLGAWLKL
jgi:hypothetical protein